MASVDDLMREVVTLRKEVRKLRGNPTTANQRAVDELTGSGEDNHERQTLAQAQRAKRSCRKPP